MSDFFSEIETFFKQEMNPAVASGMKQYMRNQFTFLGLQKPQRSRLQKPFLEKSKLPDIKDIPEIMHHLWALPEREFQYFALDLLEKYDKTAPLDFIKLYEYLIVTKSWWDTVDMLASRYVGTLFSRDSSFRSEYLQKWLNGENIWLKRTCLLYQLKYKEKTDTEILEKVVDAVTPSNEFFIDKAIGWILREYSKTNPQWVMEFVKSRDLSKLSQREACKWMKKKGLI